MAAVGAQAAEAEIPTVLSICKIQGSEEGIFCASGSSRWF